MRLRTLSSVLSGVTLALLLTASNAVADTVHLTNGEYIDGLVTSRNERLIMVHIGRIGRIEIPVEDVERIEKNNRRGTEIPFGFLPADLVDSSEGEGADDAGSEDDETNATGSEEDESTGDDAVADEDDETSESDDDPSADASDDEELSPEQEAEIEELVSDLQRQKSRYRHRAERRLRAMGSVILPAILPLVDHSSENTRIAAVRLVYEVGDDRSEVLEACVDALADENVFVREYAAQSLRRITRKRFDFNARASVQARSAAAERWSAWWSREEARREKNAERLAAKKKESKAREKSAAKSEIDREIEEKVSRLVEERLLEVLERKLREERDEN